MNKKSCFLKLKKIKTPLSMSLIIFFMALVILSTSISDMVKVKALEAATGHAGESLSLAVNAALCHKPGYMSSTARFYTLSDLFQKDLKLMNIPLVEVIMKNSGESNLHDYCATVVHPFVHGENTLNWLMQGLISINPVISFQDLVKCYFVLQMSMLWFFFYYLVCLRVPGIYILILSMVSIGTLSLQMPANIIDRYAMILPATLFLIGLLGFNIQRGWYNRGTLFTNIFVVVFSLLLGGYVVFIYNLRTSYIFVAVLSLIVYFLCMIRSINQAGDFKAFYRVFFQIGIVVVTSFSCHKFIQDASIPSELKNSNAANLTYHPISHPLVLALAVPESKFSREQGIAWNDLVGFVLAKKMDPKVDPETHSLTRQYERALFAFYTTLWKKYPKEMIRVYYEKFKLAGNFVIVPLPNLLKRPMYPLGVFNGIVVFLVQLAWLLFLIKNRCKLAPAFFFGALTFSFIGLAVYFESGIIMSAYAPAYHAFLTLWVVTLNLVTLDLFVKLLMKLHQYVLAKAVKTPAQTVTV